MGKKAKGRGRLSAIDQLPPECDTTITWAAQELRERERTQSSIYTEFYDRLNALKTESLGELDFDIPSKSAFNRYSINLAILSQRMDDTRRIAEAISQKFDAQASDDLTVISAEAIKTLIFELLTAGGEAGIDPKGAMNLANALRAAAQAQNISTQRRTKIEAEFEAKTDEALDNVAKTTGLSSDTISKIRNEFLGVRESPEL